MGDPGQLTSIEAGAVLGDIVGAATDGPLMGGAPARTRLAEAIEKEVSADDPPPGVYGIVVLERGYRFGGGIARVAEAIRRADSDAVLETLSDPPQDVNWVPVDVVDSDARYASEAAAQAVAGHSEARIYSGGRADGVWPACGRTSQQRARRQPEVPE